MKPLVIALALLAALGIPHAAGAASGGASALFSLDRVSPSRIAGGHNPSDLFVDDPGAIAGGPLTLALPFSGLGLPASANVDALSGGMSDGIANMLASPPNPMNLPSVRYQFSVGRGAIAGVSGAVPIPFAPPVIILERSDFQPQFAGNDQAADVFDNVVDHLGRSNGVSVLEEQLELLGTPPGGIIDDIDALQSVGSFGGTALDSNHDGLPEVSIYFSVDPPSPGLSPGTIYVKPPGLAPTQVYATPTQLGLEPADNIDALDVWDAGVPGVFDTGDGVIFSLHAGSPTLPAIVGGVPIDQGGVFLVTPGSGIVSALPGSYFSLSPGDELDAIHAVDPRDDLPCASPPRSSLILPTESIVPSSSVIELPSNSSNRATIYLYLNDTEREPYAGALESFRVIATVEDFSIAGIDCGGAAVCGAPDPNCCCNCLHIPCPYSPAPPSFGFCSGTLNPPVSGPNQCLGDIEVVAKNTGETRVLLSASASGTLGPTAVQSSEVIIRVTGTSAVETRSSAGAGVALAAANPFVPPADIAFTMPSPGGGARLEILDLAGRSVRLLASGEAGAGPHRASWDGRNDAGVELRPGLYFLRLVTSHARVTRKLILSR